MTKGAKRALWIVLGCLLLTTVLFAPVFGAGMCVDAQDSANSYCREWQTSLIGLETTPWMWLALSATAVVVALLVVRPFRANDSTPPESPLPGDDLT
ncbi:hypothetical protein [Microbacterium sp. LWH10-1.2]|uniref:hypothetical protein n=1 Tax=unclassified Microbacterium TaxID=2609290 RepID=UPI003139FDBC